MKDTAKELVRSNLEPLGQKEDDLEDTKLINLLSCAQVDIRSCMFLHGHVTSS